DGTEAGRATPQGFGTSLLVFVADADTLTTTNPLDNDSDDDLILDGNEDKNHNGRVDAGETNPNLADTDGDGIPDGVEDANHTGNDGLKDGNEDVDDDRTLDANETDPLVFDTDGDLLGDGLEKGLAAAQGLNTAAPPFVADADPLTTTNPRSVDTDNDGINDG